ncbi:MAG: hypothetical protein ACHP7N_06335 [Caulobacterales bacterium]
MEVVSGRTGTLVDRGVLVRTGGGVIIGAPVTSSQTAARLAEKNVAMARRFVRQLAEAGLES